MPRPILLSLVSLILVSLASCQSIDPSLQDLLNRNADFAARLYRAVSSRTDDNVFLSAFTLSTGLSALLGATSGTTQDQLLKALSLIGIDPDSVPDLFENLMNQVLLGSQPMNLRQGVGVLPRMGVTVSSYYMSQVQNKFGGNAQSLAFTAPQEAADTINHWVQERTGDQIQELVTNLDPQTQILVATAASYDIRFSPAFNASLTQDERFYVDKYHVAIVPMMFRADKYYLAYDPALKVGVLKLPLADGGAMLVVFPDEEVDITGVEEEMSGEKIRGWIRQLKKTKLEVQMPRFLLERSYTLRDSLQTLNITQVFQDDAEIFYTGEANGPKVTQVYHKCIMSVDETIDGTNSGGGAAVFSTLPPRLTINRPFLFVVYQETSGSVLLMGRVKNPTQK